MQQEKETGCVREQDRKGRVLGGMPGHLHRQRSAEAHGTPFARVAAALLCVLFLAALTSAAHAAPGKGSYIKPLGAAGKYLMHLEGTPYEMGYAMGHMRPDDVVRLVHGEYVVSMLGIVLPVAGAGSRYVQGSYVDSALRLPGVQAALEVMARDVPYEYKLEMKGIVDGTNDALGRKAITYYHVLLVNLFPALQSLVTTRTFGDYMQTVISSCHEYVAFGKATYDGRTLLGRHFMWVDDPLHEITYIVEYAPSQGRKFLSVSFPGMVGVSTGLNGAGIGIGSDFFNATGTPEYPRGLGMWFLGRKIVQYASSMADAERIIRASKESAPCFMIVGDAAGAGAVFEIYDRKVVARYASWVSNDANAPDQIENVDDLVVVSNHAFTPEMYPIDGYPLSSMTRYQVLTDLLLDGYGSIDQDSGRAIIDFMHPPSPYLTGDYKGYGSDPTQTVKQLVALMDLKSRTIWALYGHYNDPWVEYTLR
jgi:hypothetical protein